MLNTFRAISRLFFLIGVIFSLLGSVIGLNWISPASVRKKRIARVMQGHLKAMVWICGLKVQVHGPRPAGSQPFLLLSNHVSYWDILALGSLFPLGFMAKDCIASWPVLGTVIRFCNTIFVNRDDVLARWRSLGSLQQGLQELSYCVFPEGTTTAAVAPLRSQWKRGNIAVLREPGVEVWLAALHYERQEDQAWVADDALLPHLFRAMKEASIGLSIHLQPLRVEMESTLAVAAESAWFQTARLCEKAQYDWCDGDSSGAVRLCRIEDSAVS